MISKHSGNVFITDSGNAAEMVKTSVNVSAKKWRDLSVKVTQERGARKMSEVINELIDLYLESQTAR